ncbi:MAG: hypothetical protein ABIG96_06315 [Candidatus Micrarchaeota archaeon]
MVQMAAKQKTSADFSLFLLLVVVALAVVGIYFIYQARTTTPSNQYVILGKKPAEMRADLDAAFKQKYESKTIDYYDQTYGFSLRYPIGYSAVRDIPPDIYLRFAAYGTNLDAEVEDILILQKSEIDEKTILSDANYAGAKIRQETINGNPAIIVDFKNESTIIEGQSVFIKIAFISCSKGEKPYWLVFRGGVTQALSPDLELMEYMIRTVKC